MLEGWQQCEDGEGWFYDLDDLMYLVVRPCRVSDKGRFVAGLVVADKANRIKEAAVFVQWGAEAEEVARDAVNYASAFLQKSLARLSGLSGSGA